MAETPTDPWKDVQALQASLATAADAKVIGRIGSQIRRLESHRDYGPECPAGEYWYRPDVEVEMASVIRAAKAQEAGLSPDDFYALRRIIEVLPVADTPWSRGTGLLTSLQVKLSAEENRQHGNVRHPSQPEFMREMVRVEALIRSRLQPASGGVEVVEALRFIAGQENMTFAECAVAEEIVGRAKAALRLIEGDVAAITTPTDRPAEPLLEVGGWGWRLEVGGWTWGPASGQPSNQTHERAFVELMCDLARRAGLRYPSGAHASDTTDFPSLLIRHLRDVRALVAAPESAGADPVPVCQWREIATAPKDGTRILLTPAVWTAEKVVSAYYRLGLWWVESADVRGSMRAFTDPDDDASHWPFTHWMPLPAPPVALVPAEQTNKE